MQRIDPTGQFETLTIQPGDTDAVRIAKARIVLREAEKDIAREVERLRTVLPSWDEELDHVRITI